MQYCNYGVVDLFIILGPVGLFLQIINIFRYEHKLLKFQITITFIIFHTHNSL